MHLHLLGLQNLSRGAAPSLVNKLYQLPLVGVSLLPYSLGVL